LAPAPDDEPCGLAHGVAGELWALLGAAGPANATVRARLAELAGRRRTDDHGLVYWVPRGARVDAWNLTSWCSGIAGQTLLWCDAAQATRAPPWRRLAEAAAATTAALHTPEPSLCCGLAGQSLALQRYADLAHDRRFARKAYDRLVQAVERADRSSAFFGLWQGALGVALVAMYRLHGERRAPCIEPGVRPPPPPTRDRCTAPPRADERI
jgi:Lanthionine synthetase C-like protein